MIKNILRVLAAATLCVAAGGAAAQSASPSSSKPVRLYVPYTAGGVTDALSRNLASGMAARLGQPVVVENKAGANGLLGALQMKQSAPDGLSLAIAPIGIFRQPHIVKMNFDPITDLSFVSLLMDYTYSIVVRGDARWQTMGDLVGDVKSRPGAISFGSPGTYSSPHLAMEKLGGLQGLQWTHIPYKGATEMITALIGGHIDLIASAGLDTLLPQYIKEGKLRVLTTMGERRSPVYPEVPTLLEQGLNMTVGAPLGLVGPAGMDEATIARLDAAVKATVQSPEFQAMATKNAVQVTYADYKGYAAYARRVMVEEKEAMARLAGSAAK